jgi:prepilin-type N-terminal cleavage/methylation domain-containing protein
MFPVPSRYKKTAPCQAPAFTLIELLVVIGLIAVLIAATLTIIPKVQTAVYGAQTQSQMAAIATAIQAYYNDYRAYPGPLANNQLSTFFDSNSKTNEPYISDPSGNLYLAGQPDFVASAADPNSLAKPYIDATSLDPTRITGAQNLVLGLCGGLRLNTSGATPVFEYHPADLITVTVTASGGVLLAGTPKGPASLNAANPRRQQSYLNISKGDLYFPNSSVNGGAFADSAGRFSQDAMIPVFIDKYSDPLPILYYRTNVGGTAIAGLRSAATLNGTQLVDSSNNPVTPQYDLVQNRAYVVPNPNNSNLSIGTRANNPNSIHGLQGLGNPNVFDLTQTTPVKYPIDINNNGTYTPLNGGLNGIAYFSDPALNTSSSTNTTQGVARQKDGFVLISAGPDRQYGTRDDLIYPGPLQP